MASDACGFVVAGEGRVTERKRRDNDRYPSVTGSGEIWSVYP